MTPRTKVANAETLATISEFSVAFRNGVEANTSRYQRSENPVKGKASDAVSWKLKSTTTASGAIRNTREAMVMAPLKGLRSALSIS